MLYIAQFILMALFAVETVHVVAGGGGVEQKCFVVFDQNITADIVVVVVFLIVSAFDAQSEIISPESENTGLGESVKFFKCDRAHSGAAAVADEHKVLGDIEILRAAGFRDPVGHEVNLRNFTDKIIPDLHHVAPDENVGVAVAEKRQLMFAQHHLFKEVGNLLNPL